MVYAANVEVCVCVCVLCGSDCHHTRSGDRNRIESGEKRIELVAAAALLWLTLNKQIKERHSGKGR